jgi:hypothetical protein
MIQGSCLCGALRFEIDETRIIVINNCHCSLCRKVSGAAFGTFVQLPASGFRWLAGEDRLATFESSPGNPRAFCMVCGSRAPQSADWKAHVTVPAGMLDGDPKMRPEINIFTASKAPWYSITDSLPCIADRGTEAEWRAVIAPRRKRSGGTS